MLLLRALLLWSVISLHVVAAALLFRRLVPREADWLGFLVPALVFCLGLNFVEHFVAIPSLLWLLPFTTVGSLAIVIRPDFFPASRKAAPAAEGAALPSDLAEGGQGWAGFILPTGIFLGAFAFTFLMRCLQPNIEASSDGLADLNLITNFCHGDTLPPMDGWMPPFTMQYYYTFQHYCASVIVRLLGTDVGTGYNLAHALLSALTCLVAAAIGWRMTGRVWIAIALVFIIESAATGSSAYLWLTEKSPSPWTMSNLSGGLESPDSNPIWKLLATAPYRERLELQPPGYWTWRDEYHPNAGGHLLTLLSIWMLLEVIARRRSNWPWILAALIPFLAIITTTWALPITGLLCGGGLVIAWCLGNRPERPVFVGATIVCGLVAAWPTLMPLFTAPGAPPILWTKKEWHTPLYEFLIQWWPVTIPWASLLFVWRKLPVGVRWVHAVVALMLIGIEFITIEDGRYNTIEKMWGYTYGAGLITLFAAVAARPGVVYRLITGLILASAGVALCGWIPHQVPSDKDNLWHLEGNGVLRDDAQYNRILQVLGQLHRKTIITGKVIWAYNLSPAEAVFSGNSDYIAWTWSEERYGHMGENDFRAQQVNDFYDGKVTDPLEFLTHHDIRAVVIWPEDDISNDRVTVLKEKLSPDYEYIDCKGDGDKNAGVFLYQPSLVDKPGDAAR